MNLHVRRQAVLFSAFGVVVGLGAVSAAFAASSSNELIVRFHQPQNTTAEAQNHVLMTTGRAAIARTQLVSAENGVIRLTFANEAEKDAALKKLAESKDVENVAPNFLYRPAISLRFHEVDNAVEQTEQPNEQTENSYLALPFSALSTHHPKPTPTNPVPVPLPVIPGVELPTADVIAGLDPLAEKDWALTSINMPSVDQLTSVIANAGQVTAAVVDTGVDYNHEDLIGAMWRNPSDPTQVGYDFAHNNAKPYDLAHFDMEGCLKDAQCKLGIDSEKFLVNPGHGTHCAGHIGAVANNSVGIRGIGAGVQVMALKFFYDYGEQNAGSGDDAAAVQAIDFAIKNGVKVISASWGGREKKTDAESSELKNALLRARDAGVLFVVAAGNDGIDQDSDDTPSYPAAFSELDNLIVVAAVDRADNLASFSNYGAKSVQIAAPGVKILSTTVGSQYNDVVASFTDSHGKTHEMDWDGTSMATPIVAGAAALLWAKYPGADYHQIRQKLLSSVRQVPGLAGKVSTGGILNVQAALGI